MKNLALIISTIILLIGCTKSEFYPNMEKSAPMSYRSAFPTSIYLGNDTTYGRTDSACLYDYTSYLATCGVNPDQEAPIMGVTLYQILGPTYVYIRWTTVNQKQVPTLTNLKPGVYKIVGCAYMIGYRPCDSTYQNVEVYDTVQITVLKSRKPK